MSGKSFADTLRDLINENGLAHKEVYDKANITRQTHSKIISERTHPKKETVLAYAIALKLNLDETNKLLSSAGFSFTEYDEFDKIVMDCIRNKYDIFQTNEKLDEKHQKMLGSTIGKSPGRKNKSNIKAHAEQKIITATEALKIFYKAVKEKYLCREFFQKKFLNRCFLLRAAIAVTSVVVLYVCGFLVYSKIQSNLAWHGEDTFNLDAFIRHDKSDAVTEMSDENGKVILDCYDIPQKEIDVIWENVPEKIIYRKTAWETKEPRYSYATSYADDLAKLMQKYNVICNYYVRAEGENAVIVMIVRMDENGHLAVLML